MTKGYYGDIRQNLFYEATICLNVHGKPSTEYERELKGIEKEPVQMGTASAEMYKHRTTYWNVLFFP